MPTNPPPECDIEAPWHRERGASAVHYVGIMLLAAVLVGGVAAAITPVTRFTEPIRVAICEILGGTDCASESSPDPATLTPLEQALAGSHWFGGDSFASGEGIGEYDPDTNVTYYEQLPWWSGYPYPIEVGENYCHRSSGSYQAQVFSSLQDLGGFAGDDYSTQACSGAVVQDLYNDNSGGNDGEGPQMRTTPAGSNADPGTAQGPFDGIPADASLIQMSMGGNDVGFADAVSDCIFEIGSSVCGDTEAARERVDTVYGTGNGTDGTLEAQLAQVRSEHPDARIIIMGYPPLFAEEERVGYNTISVGEQRWANEQAEYLNQQAAAMCERVGCEFVDPTSAFVGEGYDHRVGGDEEWINNIHLGDTSESFHPNQAGHDAMA
ncbi:MAG: SGNH/GDSL hydrolase family protein, partial [Propioniciclava sp.]